MKGMKTMKEMKLKLAISFQSNGVVCAKAAKCSMTFCLLLAFIISSCNLNDGVKQTRALAEEIKNSKIKRVTNEQIITIVDGWGQRITKQIEIELTTSLTKQPSEAAKLCNLENLPLLDSLSKKYDVTISLLTTKDLKNNNLSAKEKEVLDAYLYNAENKLPQISNIQKIGDTVLVYNAAIPAKSLICERCVEKNLSPLAVWSIRFMKREVIRKVDGKSLLKMKK